MNSSAGYQAIGVLMIGGGLLTMYSAYKGNNVKSVLTRSITSAPQSAPTAGRVKVKGGPPGAVEPGPVSGG